jgi:hypothetical protein
VPRGERDIARRLIEESAQGLQPEKKEAYVNAISSRLSGKISQAPSTPKENKNEMPTLTSQTKQNGQKKEENAKVRPAREPKLTCKRTDDGRIGFFDTSGVCVLITEDPMRHQDQDHEITLIPLSSASSKMSQLAEELDRKSRYYDLPEELDPRVEDWVNHSRPTYKDIPTSNEQSTTTPSSLAEEEDIFAIDYLVTILNTRAVGVIVQLILTATIIVGVMLEDNISAGITGLVFLIGSLNALHLQREAHQYRRRKRRKRLKAASVWEDAAMFFTKGDTLPTKGQDNSAPKKSYTKRQETMEPDNPYGQDRLVSTLDAPKRPRFKLDFRHNVKGPRFYLKAHICGLQAPYLVDTGSEVCGVGASFLQALETQAGQRFPRLTHNQRLLGLQSEIPPSASSIVLLDVAIHGDDGDLELKSLAHFVIEGAPFQALLGMNALHGLESTVGEGEGRAYLTLKKYPELGKVPLDLSPTDVLRMQVATMQVLPPRQWSMVEVNVPCGGERPSPWDGKPLLAEAIHGEPGLTIADTMTMKRCHGRLMVKNENSHEVHLTPKREMAKVTLLEGAKRACISAITSPDDWACLSECPCQVAKVSTLAFLCNPLGTNQSGASFLTTHMAQLPTSGVKVVTDHSRGGERIIYLIPHPKKWNATFGPNEASRIKELPLKNGCLTLLLTDSTQADLVLQRFVSQLRSFTRVVIRVINPGHLCERCSKETFAGTLLYPELRVKEGIVVIPGPTRGDTGSLGDLLKARWDRPTLTFRLEDVPIHLYLSSQWTGSRCDPLSSCENHQQDIHEKLLCDAYWRAEETSPTSQHKFSLTDNKPNIRCDLGSSRSLRPVQVDPRLSPTHPNKNTRRWL